MWLHFTPEHHLLRLLPFLVLVAVGIWGLAAPGSQWHVLYGWQRRYRNVGSTERTLLVRHDARRILILAVVLGVVVWFLP